MLLGLVQLLGYRFLNHRVRIGPDDVEGLATLARYLGANYLLYLHVAGQFHLACGVLHLFGHQLPETHHNFLLASSFTDYWRRINIYWKDFMVRVFFNPVVFRLKKRPQAVALAAATAVVFLTTWALHAYQSFWLSGRWNFSVPDALFWGVLGLLVMVNVQLDARRKKKPAAPEGEWATARAGAIRAAKTAGTLATISLLWSLWTSQGVGPWLEMLRRGLLGGA
jgi:D-alanyl-lipoteichoic acid acyltransferase DltB (MBOAT superfamily)